MPGGRGVQPDSDYEWLDLSDFSAGIYDYSAVAGTAPNVPGPKGAADPAYTYACIALPHGGLGPLPALATMYEYAGTVGTTYTNYVVGLLMNSNLSDDTTEAISMVQGDDGTNQYWEADSYIVETATFNNIVSQTNPGGPGIFGSPYPFMTRMAATDPTTSIGVAVCVFPGPSAPGSGDVGQIYVYPDPGNPTVFGAAELIISGSSTAGQTLGYQGRVLVLNGGNYDYPAGGGFATNEQISYTDPPNSEDLGFQQTVLVPEAPFGYGAAGSISAGELFLVKKRGGGVVVTGDIFLPNVTFLPGVQPTGNIYGAAHSGVPGFAYCSFDNGAWLWNGGSTAQKISTQLDDSFFLPAEYYSMSSNNYGFFVRCIGQRVYFSNNWVYDLNTSSWWRYYPTAAQGGYDLYYVNETDGAQVYAARLSFEHTDTNWLFRFDQGFPTHEWQWQSLPIRLTDNRYVQLREVVVRASSNDGNGNATIGVAIFNGATQVGSVTTPSGQIGAAPTMIRMPIGGISAGGSSYASEDLTIRIGALGNGGAAPNLHSLGLGWAKRAHAPTVGVSS